MSLTIQKASTAAWSDELHVLENRRQYREKFNAVYAIIKDVVETQIPTAGFYFWAKIKGSDTEFAKNLFEQQHVTVLPGSFLGRSHEGINPGDGYVRIALVAPLDECIEAAHRIRTVSII